ncbi:hypothetical protein [Salinibacter altiplanensis]|uniref:hypothetical protein n=1 Tax=Salinibacter altiplanensis TaxID=1803181 RepID=UPI000C9F7A0C|nr:hypothetical protein [Salinibacter altiplanensis]
MDLDDPQFSHLWDRFRQIVCSVSDAQTLLDLAQKRAHRAQSNAEHLRSRDGDPSTGGHFNDHRFNLPSDAPTMDAGEWQARHDQEEAKAAVLQAMLNYFIACSSPEVPPPSLEALESETRATLTETYELIGEPKKKQEIYNAIRQVLRRDDVPSGKIKFYKAADRTRGLSGGGRATENWVRNNERDPLPGPDYWREKFDL